MKHPLVALAALVAAALAVAGAGPSPRPAAAQFPGKAQPDPRAKDAEPLPDPPLLDPKNKLVPLNPEKTFFMETTGEKPRPVRVLLVTEVCLREGPLEVFLCKKGTKEHEAILRVAVDAELVHTSLIAAGAKPGTPTEFLDAAGNPRFKPATGTPIKVLVSYRKDGKVHTHPAQEWVWNAMKKKPLEHGWVFAGSQLIKDPDRPQAKPFYAANSGEVISISNFIYSMLEIPADISKEDANLTYEARTEKLPPLFSKVWVVLEPDPGKK